MLPWLISRSQPTPTITATSRCCTNFINSEKPEMTQESISADAFADITRRLNALEDKQHVVEALNRYAHVTDYGDESEWVDCFTEEGLFEIRSHTSLEAMSLRG